MKKKVLFFMMGLISLAGIWFIATTGTGTSPTKTEQLRTPPPSPDEGRVMTATTKTDLDNCVKVSIHLNHH